MRIGTIALAASMILFATAAASASGGHPVASDPSGIVKGRQAGMRMSGAIMGSIKAAIDRGDDVKSLVGPSRSLSSWAAAIPGLFPEGSDVPPTGATPMVWSNPTGFAGQATGFKAAADKMVAAAQAGNKDDFAIAFQEARDTCSACHSDYKKS